MSDKVQLLPCPFCGSTSIDPEGWASTDRAGPACDDCSGSADTVELWNSRPHNAQVRTSPVVHNKLRDIIFFVTKTKRSDNASEEEYTDQLKKFILRSANEAIDALIPPEKE